MKLSSCDALVIGGGPAGLAAAIALRQQGLDVTVVEALVPPIDKACGEGLMPDSRRELARLGIELHRNAGCEFSGIGFVNHQNEDRVAAEFARGRGIGIRRVELHNRLIERAGQLGIALRWGMRVTLGENRRVHIGNDACHYGYLVGADGESSRVRRWAKLSDGSLWSKRLGFRRHYRVTPWSSHVEVHWGAAGQVYVTPVGENEICVAGVTSQRGVHLDAILASVPSLRNKLRGHQTGNRLRGALTTTRKLCRVVSGNVALIGDASGSADAITGEGLAMAFRQALLLADSLGRDSIENYQAGHGSILSRPQTMARILLMMDRHEWLRNRAMNVIARDPRLFARMVAVHTGEGRLSDFVMRDGLQLGWRFLTLGLENA